MVHRQIRHVTFRADGNSQIGLGHIIRSSALASAIKEDYSCTLLTRCTISEVLKEAADVFAEIIKLPERDYQEEARLFSEFSATDDLVVLDGYFFDSFYQEILKEGGYTFFSIDDIHSTEFFSSVIINHAGGLSPLDYKAPPSTQFYLGPSYSLLRPPFLRAAKKRRTMITNKNCFVCFGGADPENKTLEILKKPNIRDYFQEFHVVTGSAYEYEDDLKQLSSDKKNISIYSSISSEELVTVMRKCCFAVCSPSTVAYEYMSVGGVAFLEQIAGNQKEVFNYMIEEGLGFPIGDICTDTKQARFDLSLKKQAEHFDGKSDERFKKIFRQFFYGKGILIRRANKDDVEVCFKWANDKTVREQSYTQDPIGFQEHITWFEQKLNDPNDFFYMMEFEARPVAQIRFHVHDNEAVLGYLADENIRNRGLGTLILSKGIESFVGDYKKTINIVGHVKESNFASRRSFEKLAFKKTRSTQHPDSFKYTMYYVN